MENTESESRSMENMEYGKHGVWKARSMENTESDIYC